MMKSVSPKPQATGAFGVVEIMTGSEKVLPMASISSACVGTWSVPAAAMSWLS